MPLRENADTAEKALFVQRAMEGAEIAPRLGSRCRFSLCQTDVTGSVRQPQVDDIVARCCDQNNDGTPDNNAFAESFGEVCF